MSKDKRKPYGFSLNPKIVKPFMELCKDRGWIASRRLELLLMKFNENKGVI